MAGAQSERDFPYAGLLSVLRLLEDDVGALAPPQRDALRSVLASTMAGVEAFVVSAGLLALLATAAERRPLVVLVDDVQWLDEPSRDALGFVGRRLGADAVAVVLASRPGGLGELGRVADTVMELAPLDEESSAAILAGATQIDPSARAAVMAAAHGNPLALLELPQRLSIEQREGRAPLPPALVAGELVESAFAEAASALPDASRTALAIAALLEADGVDVFEAAAARLGVSLVDLEPAEALGLISLAPARLTFRHPLVRAAVLRSAGDRARRDVHRAIAEILPPGERRALHLAEATVGTDDEVATELIAAARDVPPTTAAALITRAADLISTTPARARALGEAARLAYLAGRLEQAAALVERGVALDPIDRVRGELLVTSGRIASLMRSPAEALELLLQGAALLEPDDRGAAVAAYADAFRASLGAGSAVATSSIVQQIFSVVDRSNATERMLADLASGISAVQAGRRAEGEHTLRALLDGEEQEAGTTGSLDTRVVAALWLFDYPRVLVELERAIGRARTFGHLSPLPQLLQFQGFAEARSGRFGAAYAAISEATAMAEELGQVVVWADALNTLAGLEARLGLHDRCRAHALLAIERSAALGLDWFRRHAMLNLALSEVAVGRAEHAAELVEEVHDMLRRAGVKDPDEYGFEYLVDALVRLGRRDDAAAALAEMHALWAGDGGWEDNVSAVCAAALAADDDRSPALFELALSLDSGYAPFEHAHIHLLYGERLRRAGERRRAREQLRAALDVFEKLGADWWVERCRRELAASGARLRTRDSAHRDELTPQELQVALQVARGLSNREIARTLFLSPKTVEFHLTRIYRKLDINARAELIERFADQVS